MMLDATVIGSAAIGFIAFQMYKKWKNREIAIPSTARRDGIYYGYYGRLGNQVSDVKDHTNLLWESQFEGPDVASKNILAAATFTVLDISPQTMKKIAPSGRNYAIRDDAEVQLRSFFTSLRLAGALKYVKAIYPMDEPNTNTTEKDLKACIDIARKVAAEFIELRDVKFLCIYAAKPETYECFSEFDYVGVDDYDERTRIFSITPWSKGCYTKLKEKLLAHQKTILLPGGAFGQSPTPFVNFAYGNSEVAMIVPFVWFGPMQPADKWVGISDPANPLKIEYINAGKTVINNG